VYVQAVWKLKIPPRVQIFLWLLSKNKLLTRNNLGKRRELDDLTCLFCSETITIHHLFFYCCVAKFMWSALADIPVRLEEFGGIWMVLDESGGICERKILFRMKKEAD